LLCLEPITLQNKKAAIFVLQSKN